MSADVHPRRILFVRSAVKFAKMSYPPLPRWNPQPLEARLADVEKLRGKVPSHVVTKIEDSIRRSAKDCGEGPSIDSFPQIKGHLTIGDIQKVVAWRFWVTVEDIVSHGKFRRFARPRYIAMYLVKILIRKSTREISQGFGRDPSVVLAAARKIGGLIETDKALAEDIEALKGMLLRGECGSSAPMFPRAEG